jgi:drug/metabolite transporter (DMT)-like permease
MAAFYVLDRTVNTILCGLLLLLFIFPRVVGVSWRSQIFGIALGLGALACLSLGTSAIRSQIEPMARNRVSDIMDLVTHATYLCSLFIWLGYSLRAERGSRPVVKTLPDHNLETWNQELQRLLHQ